MTSVQPYLKRAGKYPIAWLPRPDFAHEYVDLDAPRAGVLHTEEGSFDGSERIFAIHYAPHFVVGIHDGKPTIWQHVPIGIIGAACRQHNNKALVQIELEGYSRETPWLPDAVRLDLLASLMLACRDAYGIPLLHPWMDGDFGRAGANPHRSSGKFGTVAGWFGHGDMPPNDSHWDPGCLQWSKVFAHAASLDAIARRHAPTPASSPLPPQGGEGGSSNKPVAPAAAAPASHSAATTTTTESTTMTAEHSTPAAAPKKSLLSELETGAVDFGAGILNTFENIGTQLGTAVSTVAAGKTTTTDGTTLPSVTANGSNDLSAIDGAYNDIKKLVADARGGNVLASVKDGVDFAVKGYAVLSGWGINVPALGTFMGMLQKVEAFIPA